MLGEVLFQYHCNDCHARSLGYSAVGPLVRGRSTEMIRDTIEHLHEDHFVMPPWSGTPQEAQLLAEYLARVKPSPPRPRGMFPRLNDSE